MARLGRSYPVSRLVAARVKPPVEIGASLSATVGVSAGGLIVRPASVSLALSASTSATAPFKNSGAAGSLAVAALPSATAFKNAGVVAGFAATVTPSVNGLRDAVAGSSAAITADPSVTSQESGVATGSLGVSVTATGEGFRYRDIAGGLSVSATATAGAARVAAAAASLDVTATNTGYYGLPHGTVPPKISALQDYFNTKDTAKWAWAGTAGVSGGRLVLPTPGTNTITQVAANSSTGAGLYDLNESYVVGQLVTPPGAQGGCYTGFSVINLNAGSTATIYAFYQNGNWSFWQTNNSNVIVGTSTVVSYASAGSWVKVALQAGTLTWSTSPDGVAWTVQKSAAVAGTNWWGARAYVFITGSDAAAGSAVWDNFNILPNEISASTAVEASTSAGGVRGMLVGGSLSAVAAGTGTPRYDPKAQATLSANAYPTSGVTKTLNGAVSLAVTSDISASGTEFGTASAACPVVASMSASMQNDAAAVAGYSGVGNFVHNYGFEADSPFSSTANVWRSTEQARSGGYSAKITGNAGYPNVTVTDFVSVTPGDRFYVEAWVKAHAGNTNSSGTFFIGCIARNSSSVTVGYSGPGFNASSVNSSTWTRCAGIVVAPPNSADMKVFIQLNENVPAGQTYYFDDVIVAKLDPLTVGFPAIGSRGQGFGVNALAVESASPAAGFVNYRPGASLAGWSTPSAQGFRNAIAGAASAIAATATATVVEYGVGQASLSVSATASAGMMKTRYISATASIGVLSVPSAVRLRLLDTSLAVSMSGWGAIEEVAWDVRVPAYERRSQVPVAERRVAAPVDVRLVSVPADGRSG